MEAAWRNVPTYPFFSLKEILRFPLIVECKLIDKKAKKEVALYGSEGLARFLNGDMPGTLGKPLCSPMCVMVRPLETV